MLFDKISRFLARGVRLWGVLVVGCLLCADYAADNPLWRIIVAAMAASFLITLPTLFFNKPYRQALQILIGEVAIAACAADAYCLSAFSCSLSPQILLSTLQTNSMEASNFISSMVTFAILKQWRVSYLVLLMLLLPCLYLPFVVHASVVQRCRRWLGSQRWLRMACALSLAACLTLEAAPTARFLRLFGHNKDLTQFEGMIFRKYHQAVPTPFHRFAYSLYALNISRHTLAMIKEQNAVASVDRCSHRSPHIVLIIGESYNKHHAQLYGYNLSTTPRQCARAAAGELVPFADAVTPWNITSNLFLELFTVGDTAGRSPMFPTLFRRSGYRVSFFSNQYVMYALFSGPTNQAGNFFLSDKPLSDTLFDYRNKSQRSYDMGLLGEVGGYIADSSASPYTLDIIHLTGQHFDYRRRYPDTEAFFDGSYYAERGLDSVCVDVVQGYDNATLYNDKVVDSLLSLYEAMDAVVVYVADHGEEVYDGIHTHGRLFGVPDKAQATNEFEVPMWIWCSPSYRERHPDIVAAIRRCADRPLYTADLSQLLLYLAGIECRWRRPDKNILADSYVPPMRMIAGTFNYDEIVNR